MMKTAYLTRQVRFSAAHRYHRPDWSDEENRRVFGACSNPHGHGHNYLLEVTVAGEIDPVTGYSIDRGLLDRLLDEVVVRPLDHQHLNHVVEEFRSGGAIPTCENILVQIWPRIQAGIPAPARLYRLRLYEDPTLYVDYFGGAPRLEE
jgi:6-pyruvoyltetrahydropterin/6-carboxytetrahydropterin synthase